MFDLNIVLENKISSKKGELSPIEIDGNPYHVAFSLLNAAECSLEEKEITMPRASSLYDACIRKHILCSVYKTLSAERVDFNGKMIFGYGNAIHHWAQNTDFLFGDNRYGFWRCLACNKVTVTFGCFPKNKCSCGASFGAYTYHEFGGKCPGLDYTYHIDMFIKVMDLFRIVEMKTIKDEEFEKLSAPLIQHEFQVHSYALGSSLDDRIPKNFDDKVAYILYFSKKYKRDRPPIKMYPVIINPRTTAAIVAKVKSYSDGMKSFPKQLPAVLDRCKSKDFDNYNAKKCPVCWRCRELC